MEQFTQLYDLFCTICVVNILCLIVFGVLLIPQFINVIDMWDDKERKQKREELKEIVKEINKEK